MKLRLWVTGLLLVFAPAFASEKGAAAGTGRTLSTTVQAKAAIEDTDGHELSQSVGIDHIGTPDAIAGVSFDGASFQTHDQADLVQGSGQVRGYGVWEAKTGEKLFLIYGYSIPPRPAGQSGLAPFEGTFEWIGGTGRLKNVRGKGTIEGEVTRYGEARYRWAGTFQQGAP
jgi:hypothetical protein